LIIDEATSEISQELEDKVLNNILRYYKDKTILFVSHKNKDYLFRNIIKIK
jgi:ABC-type transport system involved in cytochrome bd biosynthesis fused ATPase/permease subunit